LFICEDYHVEEMYMNHKLLLVIELIFCNNPKANGKILFVWWRKPECWPTKIRHNCRSLLLKWSFWF